MATMCVPEGDGMNDPFQDELDERGRGARSPPARYGGGRTPVRAGGGARGRAGARGRRRTPVGGRGGAAWPRVGQWSPVDLFLEPHGAATGTALGDLALG